MFYCIISFYYAVLSWTEALDINIAINLAPLFEAFLLCIHPMSTLTLCPSYRERGGNADRLA